MSQSPVWQWLLVVRPLLNKRFDMYAVTPPR